MNPLTNYAEVFNKNDSKLFAELFADGIRFQRIYPNGILPAEPRGPPHCSLQVRQLLRPERRRQIPSVLPDLQQLEVLSPCRHIGDISTDELPRQAAEIAHDDAHLKP